MRFIDKESIKASGPYNPKWFWFKEGGREGQIQCKYVPNGTVIYSRVEIKQEAPVLAIKTVEIEKNNGCEKNIIDRIAREVLKHDKIKGVCVEAVMSSE